MKEIDPGLADALDVVAKARLEKAVTEHKPHSELRADVARERERRHWTINQWRKVDPDWPGAMARCRKEADDAVDSLFEQHEALLAEWSDYRATTEDIITDLKEQLQSAQESIEVLQDENALADLVASTQEQLEMLRGWIADEAAAGLPLPKPIRAIVKGSNPATERDDG